MATKSIETQQRRLRLKAEELKLRVTQQDNKRKLSEIKNQLKAIGGRIR